MVSLNLWGNYKIFGIVGVQRGRMRPLTLSPELSCQMDNTISKFVDDTCTHILRRLSECLEQYSEYLNLRSDIKLWFILVKLEVIPSNRDKIVLTRHLD